MLFVFLSIYIIIIYIFFYRIINDKLWKDKFGYYKYTNKYFYNIINWELYVYLFFMYSIYIYMYLYIFITINFIYYYSYVNTFIMRVLLKYWVDYKGGYYNINYRVIFFINNLFIIILFIKYNFCIFCFIVFIFLLESFFFRKSFFFSVNKFVNFFFYKKK